jgi:K+/H+ antiporter YhaU regulatory subunit KhtT
VTILLDLPNGECRDETGGKGPPGSVGSYFRKTGVRIIGIESPGRSIVAPSADEVLINGDDVVAVGTTEQLKKFIHQI